MLNLNSLSRSRCHTVCHTATTRGTFIFKLEPRIVNQMIGWSSPTPVDSSFHRHAGNNVSSKLVIHSCKIRTQSARYTPTIRVNCSVFFPLGLLISDALALCCGEDSWDGLFQVVRLPNEEWVPLGQKNGGIHFFQAEQRQWKAVVCSCYPKQCCPWSDPGLWHRYM